MRKRTLYRNIFGSIGFITFACVITAIIISLPTTNPTNGIWQGVFDINGQGQHDFTALYMEGKVIASSHSANVLYQGKVSASNAQYQSTMDMYIMNKGVFDDVELTGKFLSPDNIQAQYATGNNQNQGGLALTYRKSLFEKPVSLEQLNGEWILYHVFNILKIKIDNGILRGADNSGCSYDGAIDLITPKYNAYTVHMAVSSCNDLSMELKGMAYLDDDLNSNDTFQMHLFSSDWNMYMPIVRNDDTRLIDKNKAWGPPGASGL